MKRRHLFILGGLILILHAWYSYNLTPFIRRPERISYHNFNITVAEIAHLISLLAFLAAAGLASLKLPSEKYAGKVNRLWCFGFLAVLFPLVGLSIYVNPHGVFAWNKPIPTRVAARMQKLELYQHLDSPPQVVLMGSSRAFLIPSAYVEQATGYKTFNMAVEGGSLSDFLPFERFIISEQDPPPLLFIVELVTPSLTVPQEEVLVPISLMPYISLGDRVIAATGVLKDLVGFQAISDSLFQLIYYKFPLIPVWSFQPDGTGLQKPVSEEIYLARLKALTVWQNEIYKCHNLDVPGMARLEALVQLADEHKIGVLFYRSPLNADYLDVGDIDHPLFKRCDALFQDYMMGLITQHNNVFLDDLTYYEPIGSLRSSGYYDVHHLKPKAARMLIAALTPDIAQAAAWALQQRDQITPGN